MKESKCQMARVIAAEKLKQRNEGQERVMVWVC